MLEGINHLINIRINYWNRKRKQIINKYYE